MQHVTPLPAASTPAPVFSFRERNAYAHANMRLRTRFDMEITIEEWHRLGDLFRKKKINGVRRNHVGDQEGWVVINGTPVCCYYSAQHGCVKTFYASAPPMPTESNIKATKVRPPAPVVKVVTVVTPAPTPPMPKVESTDPKAVAAKARKKERFESHMLERSDGVYRRDLRWFKGIVTSTIRREWSRDEVWFFLSSLISLPENLHPSLQPEKALAFIKEGVEGKRVHARTPSTFSDGEGI